MATFESHKPAVFFMSDAHLGLDEAGEPGRIRAITSFFNSVKEAGGDLFIVGDFFDFWFEYKSVIPRRHFTILSAMKDLTSSGIEVTYIGGNHDYWLGGFLRDEIGLRVCTGPVELAAQGLKIYLIHGDGLTQRDRFYPLFRWLLRNKLTSTVFRLIHPDLGLPMAACVSKLSRGVNPDWAPEEGQLWDATGAPHFNRGFDAVILGHIHTPVATTRNGKSLYVLGDWISRYSYLELRNGAFEQHLWSGASHSR